MESQDLQELKMRENEAVAENSILIQKLAELTQRLEASEVVKQAGGTAGGNSPGSNKGIPLIDAESTGWEQKEADLKKDVQESENKMAALAKEILENKAAALAAEENAETKVRIAELEPEP